MNKYEKICYNLEKIIEDGKRIPLLKIIRCKCLDCVCYVPSEVLKCPIKKCILYAYRMGKNPVKRIMSEVHRKKLINNLKKARTKLSK